MGSEWGLGPLRIGSTTADVSAIHWFAASRAPKARAVPPPGGRLGLTSGDPRQHRRATVPGASGRASRRPRTRAPHGEERSEKTGGRTSARTASDRDRTTR
jgi:hypothetical protein